MPIEVAIEGRPEPSGYVAAGSYVNFPGFLSKKGKIVGAHCLPDDSGGEIYILDPIDLIEDYTIPVTPEEIYTKNKLIKKIGPEKPYRIKVTTESGASLKLVFKYVVRVNQTNAD